MSSRFSLVRSIEAKSWGFEIAPGERRVLADPLLFEASLEELHSLSLALAVDNLDLFKSVYLDIYKRFYLLD